MHNYNYTKYYSIQQTMQLSLHLPKPLVLTIVDIQKVHHIIPQLVLVLGGKNGPAKLRVHPPCVVLHNAVARSTSHTTWS